MTNEINENGPDTYSHNNYIIIIDSMFCLKRPQGTQEQFALVTCIKQLNYSTATAPNISVPVYELH